MMSEKQYKLRGGVNWFNCEVIAEFENKVWINNLTNGSKPTYNLRDIEFRDKPKEIREKLYYG